MSINSSYNRFVSSIGTPVNPLKLLTSPEPWLALVFMLLSFAIGVFWFIALVTLLAIGFGLAITLVGLPILYLTLLIWTYGARLERLRVKALLGVEIQEPHLPRPEDGWWQGVKAQLRDRHVWLDLLYLVLLFPIGVAEITAALFIITFPISLISLPGYFWATDFLLVGPDIRVDSLPLAILGAIIGIPLFLAMPYVLVGFGRGHAWLARHLLGTNRELELSARVQDLTASRTRAMDSALGDLRRIERDLHDGAQQRLVKLSMDLGMAKEKLKSDPAAAEALLNEAHEESKRAMSEIRNLARGIHPAVLTDRGLDAAISALAGQSPVPVTVNVELDRRLPDALESTAYFIVAEALTNITRHSQATTAYIDIRITENRLSIDIFDNGVGGANSSHGTGLTGMADRAAAFDGVLRLESPDTGGTRIRVEIPCEL